MQAEDQRFEKLDSADGLPGREFSGCVFLDCNFEKANFSAHDFVGCVFENCNLGLADLKSAGLKDVTFTGCKLSGVDFSVCNPFLFQVSFTGCVLDYAVFQRMKMKQAVFRDCSIREAHFSGVDLSGALFAECDLSGAFFEGNNFEKADLRTARNFSIDPEQNKMKKAKVELEGLPGLLGKYGLDIH